jgi:hypothetical protein
MPTGSMSDEATGAAQVTFQVTQCAGHQWCRATAECGSSAPRPLVDADHTQWRIVLPLPPGSLLELSQQRMSADRKAELHGQLFCWPST